MSLLRPAQKCLANQTSYAYLNAFISLPSQPSVLSQVENAASKTGPLAGKLIAIKDNITTTDLPTTAASGILKSFRSPYDATVVKQLREDGAIIAGKTNMDEFGMGSHSKHSFFGAVKQDGHNGKDLSAGGSSGGSAVAVATGQCWAALGTDTGGSVRLPAAYAGIVGFKPSYGLLSRWGVIAYANSLDTVGILSHDVDSALAIFNATNSHDPKDPTSLSLPTRSRITSALQGLGRTNNPLRIGVPLDYNIHELHPTVRNTWTSALTALRSLGATIHPVSLPMTRHALSAYYVLAPAEASSNLAKYDGVRYGSRAAGVDGTPSSVLFSRTRGEGFGDEVKRRIVLGAFTLSADAIDNYFIQAQKVRRLVQRDFESVLRIPNPLLEKEDQEKELAVGEGAEVKVDVVVCPTTPTLPPSLEEVEKQRPVDAYMNDVLTVPASLAGLPAVSVPVRSVRAEKEYGTDGGTVGIQVIGQYGDDHLVLDVAKMLEEAGR